MKFVTSVPILLLICVSSCWTCPVWTIASSDSKCECGSGLQGVVHCNPETLKVSVLFCHCMTYSSFANETVVGRSSAMCAFRKTPDCRSYNQIQTNDSDMLNSEICLTERINFVADV